MTQMTHSDWIALAALRAIARLQPVTTDELVFELRDVFGRAGLVPECKVDEALVGRDILAAWHKAELLEAEYAPDDFDPGGRLRPGARRGYLLTAAGSAELTRLECQAGVLA
jgi:hypothetical protein